MGARDAVVGRLVTEFEELTDPGTFQWGARQDGRQDTDLIAMCPCGCGEVFSVPVIPGGSHAWSWDGNREQPTLSPSIRRIGGCKWHGHLQNGTWVPTGDSGD